MSGVELFEHLSARHPEVRVLDSSGYTGAMVVSRGVLLEDVPFLHKPYSLQELFDKVRQALAWDPASGGGGRES